MYSILCKLFALQSQMFQYICDVIILNGKYLFETCFRYIETHIFFCNILSCYQVYQPLSKKQKCICNKALICLIAPILPVAKATNNKEKKNDERNITITQYF